MTDCLVRWTCSYLMLKVRHMCPFLFFCFMHSHACSCALARIIILLNMCVFSAWWEFLHPPQSPQICVLFLFSLWPISKFQIELERRMYILRSHQDGLRATKEETKPPILNMKDGQEASLTILLELRKIFKSWNP